MLVRFAAPCFQLGDDGRGFYVAHQFANVLHLPSLCAKFIDALHLADRFAREALGCTASGLSHQRFLPGARQPFGHRHTREEEIYLVLSGSGRLRLDDEIIDIAALDAIRVSPAVIRAFEAGPDGLEVVAFGAPGLGGPDADMVPGWWETDGSAVA